MLNPYIRLMRFHQPTGIWLLLFPCWWSVALASRGFPSLWLMLLFALGAVVMRSAGCIINDIADREFDRKVERTRSRPLASGELSVRQAGMLLILLLAIANLIALQMRIEVLWWVLLSLPLVAAYPYMKRITWWPQAFLGLTFNWGALVGWVAVRGEIELPALLLYAGGIAWTLGYDTIYAHQDIKDDIAAGVKSTALRLGGSSTKWITAFYAIAVVCWTLAIGFSCGFVPAIIAAFALLGLFRLHLDYLSLSDPASCMQAFRANVAVGAWMTVLCIFGELIP